MSELPIRYSDIFKQVSQRFQEYLQHPDTAKCKAYPYDGSAHVLVDDWFLPEEEWNSFRESLQLIDGFIGMGRNRVTIRHPTNPSKAVSIYRQPREWPYLMETRALHKILKILFPHNFPAVYASFGYDDMYSSQVIDIKTQCPNLLTGHIVDKIHGLAGQGVNLIQGYYSITYDPDNLQVTYGDQKRQAIIHPFQSVINACRCIDFPLDYLGFDPWAENFILGDDGGEYYIDLLEGPLCYRAEQGINDWEWWDSATIASRIEGLVAEGRLQLTSNQLRAINHQLVFIK